MNTFPTDMPIRRDGYSVDPIEDRVVSRADDGTPIIRDLWPITRYSIELSMLSMSNQQVRDIRAFYQANKFDHVIWVDPWDGDQEYTVVMLSEPRIVDIIGPWAIVSVSMEGVRGA